MSSHSVEPRGSVSAFTVCVVGALVLVGLFVAENGRFINEYTRVSDVAENAARMAAQNVVGIRQGEPHIDLGAARSSALSYMREQGVEGSVAQTGTGKVEIHARVRLPLRGLAFLRIGDGTIDIVRRSMTVDG